MADVFPTHLSITGTGVNDNDLLLTVDETDGFSAFMLMSSAGAVDVEITLDGTNWSTAPLSLQDFGAASLNPVLVTVAGRVYGFVGKFRGVRIRQNGATGATATLVCWNYGTGMRF